MGLCSNGVHGEFLPEGFLFTPVSKPVIDSDFSDQIGAKALSFGGRDTPLKTLSSMGNRFYRVKITVLILFEEKKFKENTAR